MRKKMKSITLEVDVYNQITKKGKDFNFSAWVNEKYHEEFLDNDVEYIELKIARLKEFIKSNPEFMKKHYG